MNPLLLTDSYKMTHWPQYPPGTTQVHSYFESRGGKFKSTMFFGLQYYLLKYLSAGHFGSVVTAAHVIDAAQLMEKHFGARGLFNRAGWDHVVRDHSGKLPLRIKAVPEGTLVPTGNVLMTVENTCPQCYWQTNYWETLLVQTWFPTTVCTVSWHVRQIILSYLERTGTPADIDFKLHDFGYRGVSSVESAGIGGTAHLVNFKGTDTLAALDVAHRYYQSGCAGHSIPASEHSTITAWGPEGELAAYENMLDQYPTGLVACVSDSWDIFRACSKHWGHELRARVLQRDGCLVVRPDSGYPPEVVLKCLGLLAEAFGDTRNSKGYRVLDPHVRLIWGDGVDHDMIHEILHRMQTNSWSTDNIAFGMGGGLLQKIDRDTQKFAFKASQVTISGVETDVWKDPVTDSGKRSKRGRLALIRDETSPTGMRTVRDADAPLNSHLLRLVFQDGAVMNTSALDLIRERARREENRLKA